MATCSKCNGYGLESCGTCWGGQKRILCMGCSGRGYIKSEQGEEVCQRCGGDKRFIPVGCTRCTNSYPCPFCNGTGKV